MSLDGRVALVTGASRGIGAAIAIRLARAGADVAVGYGRDEEAAGRVAAGISELGRRSVVVGGDVGDPSELDEMVSAVEREFGPVDVLVSNAGIAPAQELEEITVEDWDHVMGVNLRPAFLLAKRIAPGMRERGWGRVVLVSSVAAFTGGIVGPHYTASKAALVGLARSLAGPLAPYGVTVNAVAPALIEGGETLPGDEESRAYPSAGSAAPRRSRKPSTRSSRTRSSRPRRSPWTAGCTPANLLTPRLPQAGGKSETPIPARTCPDRGVVSSCR